MWSKPSIDFACVDIACETLRITYSQILLEGTCEEDMLPSPKLSALFSNPLSLIFTPLLPQP